MKLSVTDKQDIVHRYDSNNERMVDIASMYSCSRARVWQVLKEYGVNTTKRRITIACAHCGNTFKRTKAHVRKTTNNYCSKECYYNAIANENTYWRHGMRIARVAVSKVFNLQPYHIVHHKDGDNRNNNINNLSVYASQGDHVKHHRGIDVVPLWTLGWIHG